MTSTFSANIGLELPAHGDYVDTWEIPVNADMTILDQAIGGSTALNVVAQSGIVALSSTQYRSRVFTASGLLSAAVNYQLPTGVGGFWFVRNATTGAFALTFSSAGGGTSVVLTQGVTTALTSDGTNIRRADTNASGAGGSDTQIQFNSSGTLAGSSSFTWNGSAVTAPTFIGALTGAATSVGNALTVNNSNAGSASGITFNGAAAITISRNTIGAAASGTNTDITALNATGGLLCGAATGGAQGTGTINATALYVNGLAVSAGSGAVSSVNASGGSTGFSFTGGPITTSGTLTLLGTLNTTSGGTGLTSFTSGGAMYATSTSVLTTGTLPVTAGGTGITSLGSGVATWLGTPSSANLASAVTGETGSGALVFGTSPTIDTPTVAGTAAMASLTFSGTIGAADGSSATPSYSFSGDTNSGMYRIGADDIGFATGGTLRLEILSTSIKPIVPVLVTDGAVGAPTISFQSDTDTGLYSFAPNQIGFAAGGSVYAVVSSSGVDVVGTLRADLLRLNATPTVSSDTVTHKLAINLNNTTYYMLLSNV